MLVEKIEDINRTKLNGKIIAFPTDTVFGVGAIIDDIEAINKIYKLKKRSFNKPLSILVANIEEILPYIKLPSEEIVKLMRQYWPGALTIIFEKTNIISEKITMGFNTIAFRIPNSQIALDILSKTGPLATTSVNFSGEEPLNSYQEIEKKFGENIDYIVAFNEESSNVSSTVIDVTNNTIKIVRQGQIEIK